MLLERTLGIKKELEKIPEQPLVTRKTLKLKQGDEDAMSVLDSVEGSQEKSNVKSNRKQFDDNKSIKSSVSRRGGLAARD